MRGDDGFEAEIAPEGVPHQIEPEPAAVQSGALKGGFACFAVHFVKEVIPISRQGYGAIHLFETMSAGDRAVPKEFARRLLEYEAATSESSRSGQSAAFSVCEKLRGRLSKLLGVEGYNTLLRRALALAGAEVPSLRNLQITPDGSLEGMDKQEAVPGDQAAAAQGEVALVGHLLGLLVIFIGPALTLQLLHEVWPKWTITISEEKLAL